MRTLLSAVKPNAETLRTGVSALRALALREKIPRADSQRGADVI